MPAFGAFRQSLCCSLSNAHVCKVTDWEVYPPLGIRAKKWLNIERGSSLTCAACANRLPQSGLKMEELRAMLGRFGLAGHHHLQPIVKLSGAAVAPAALAPEGAAGVPGQAARPTLDASAGGVMNRRRRLRWWREA